MNMLTVLTIFGTRPEAVKMAPLIKELQKRPTVRCLVCVTAQHREMLDGVLETFGIEPDFDLNIMKNRQSLTDITVAALTGIGEVIGKCEPDILLVHGDTATTFAGALAAYFHRVPVGHVEAGLRTYDKYSPFPEEMSRQMTDCVCDMYFAPTEQSRRNLLAEGKPDEKIFVTGNTAIDALSLTVRPSYTHPLLEWAADSRLILLTAHRRESLGEPMRNIFRAVNRITNEFGDVKFLYPVHPNPAVRDAADAVLKNNERVRLCEPLEVTDFHNFLSRAYFVLTDSGGIQEEAPGLDRPVLVARDTTERPEGVEAGTLKLVGTDENRVYEGMKLLLTDEREYMAMSTAENPYGDGFASARIVNAVLDFQKNLTIKTIDN